jgi:hypothetical protein
MFQGILPKVPNLQLGYNYTFGPKLRAGTASIDYLLPFKFGADSTIYGEAHGEFQSLSIAQPGSPNNSVELCLGGGYRRMLDNHTMIGLHSFFDTTKLSGVWYSSGSVGAEMAAMVAGQDAIDVNFNWYGNALDASFFSNSLGFVPATGEVGFGNANFDFQAGYSHELYNGGPDLRLSVTGYKFDTGSGVSGYYAGAELKSRDGVFVLKYDVGYDKSNQVYQSVAAFMNMGFQLENLAAGKSPFVMPKPVFQSPRNMTTLTEAKVNRNWRQTTQSAEIALLSVKPKSPQCTPKCLPQTITVVNQRGAAVKLYMNFNANALGGYDLATDFPGWTIVPAPPPYTSYLLTTTMKANDPPLVIKFNCTMSATSVNIAADNLPQTGCSVTQAEFTLCGDYGQFGGLIDNYDISLVNGFNYPMEVTPTDPQTNIPSGQAIKATSETGNANNIGVFGKGWTNCNSAPNPPCTPVPGENHTPAPPATPVPLCQLQLSNGKNFTVTILP